MKHKATLWITTGAVVCVASIALAMRMWTDSDPQGAESGSWWSGKRSAVVEGRLVAAEPSTCKDAPNGAECGETGSGMRCVFSACMTNVCGDAIILGEELCDDGNLADGDGCDATCHWEHLASCGNQKLDPGEQCDDGNALAGDACTQRCTLPRCGDGAQGPDEQCDDGNVDDTDGCDIACKKLAAGAVRVAGTGTRLNKDGTVNLLATGPTASGRGADGKTGSGAIRAGSRVEAAAGGSAGSAAGSAGAGNSSSGSGATGRTVVANNPAAIKAAAHSTTGVFDPDACHSCRERECRNYHGIDLIRGCFEGVDPSYGAGSGDANFLHDCAQLVQCARDHACGEDHSKDLGGCYCGSAELNECNAQGPALDAPCLKEVVAAARSDKHAEIMERASNFAFPYGWAFFMVECEVKRCASVCTTASDDEGSGA